MSDRSESVRSAHPSPSRHRVLARVLCLATFAAVSGQASPGPFGRAAPAVRPSRHSQPRQAGARAATRAGPVRALALAGLLVLLIAGLTILSPVTANADTVPLETAPAGMAEAVRQADQAWRFRVFLDDKEIGYHHFYLDDQGDSRVLNTFADFEYRLLFVTLYGYVHRNNEVWQGDCLERIESSTDANGKPFAVSGALEDNNFVVTGSKGEARLPGCVMSFAYWNPAFLEAAWLLNSQDGEYLEVEVSPPVPDLLEIRGQQLPSYRYALAAGKLKLQLWYSVEDHQWLGLQSEAAGGRMLRYELL